jgi:hypothetical protein
MPDITNSAGAVAVRCRCLRSKEMFFEAEPDLTIPNTSSGLYWCVHTQNCLGPDGQVAEPENCQPGRACFEAV